MFAPEQRCDETLRAKVREYQQERIMTSERPSASIVQADSLIPAEASANSAHLTIDATLIAPLLGLAPDAFMDAIKRGAISQLAERGIDDDEGRYRVTFRYRRRRCRLVVHADIGTAAPA